MLVRVIPARLATGAKRPIARMHNFKLLSVLIMTSSLFSLCGNLRKALNLRCLEQGLFQIWPRKRGNIEHRTSNIECDDQNLHRDGARTRRRGRLRYNRLPLDPSAEAPAIQKYFQKSG